MYEYIAGQLAQLSEELAIVEVSGIGYGVRIPRSTHDAIEGRAHVELFTELRLRDEQFYLYGFASLEERNIFRRLCTISGVGPGTALTILSGVPLPEFRAAVHEGNAKVFERVKGIGKKTASRLILELSEVLVLEPTEEAKAGAPASGLLADAIGALVAIGFSTQQAESAVQLARRSFEEEPDLEALVKLATRLTR